ncbi:hypothetical protein [Bacteroides thetaiotaomicron]|uniref:hypothetical protein n=1 Tax=Bacteroides thetaiotaomicron TaxID=818 RepID=UPI0034A5A22C
MEKEQLLKMAEQVKKTCKENGISILMIAGDTEGNKANGSSLLIGREDILITMIVGLMEENPNFSKLIQKASEYYSVQQRESKQESLAKDFEELFKALRDAIYQTRRG